MNKLSGQVNQIRYLLLFLIFFGVVIIAAIVYKTIRLVQGSRFTGGTFNVAIIDNKDVYVIHTDQADKATSLISVKNLSSDALKHDPLAYSIFLGVPIQAIILNRDSSAITPFDKHFFSLSHLMNIAGNNQYQKIGLNTDDLLKIYLDQKNIPSENKQEAIFSPNNFQPEQFAKTDGSLYSMFKELNIINNQVSVQVINATDVNGLGARVSRIFENWGYDVVSVISGSQTSSQIIVHTVSDQNFAQGIQQVTNFPIIIDGKPSLADITIVVANDTEQKLSLNSSIYQ